MVTIQIKNSTTDRVVGTLQLTPQEFGAWAQGQLAARCGARLHFAGGRTEDLNGRLRGRCSFSFVR